MLYYSTKNPDHKATLSEAVFRGLAPDGGLYLPVEFRPLSAAFFDGLAEMDFSEINYTVAKALIGDSVPDGILRDISAKAVNFPTPVVEIEPGIFSLELFHGPTLAFKDVGARFMALLLGYFAETQQENIKVIVATSGDTGGAVAAGFFNVPGVEVYILYPKGRVSSIQEKQLTTWGKNITAIEVEGSFDECQALAKKMLGDKELNSRFKITSANSINIARLIPQSFYYFHLYAQLKNREQPIAVCVPSGNFGNLTAGLMGKKLGLPIELFVAATNANDVVPAFMETGTYRPRASVQTISNAMDVGSPSNFERMQDLFGTAAADFAPFLEADGWSDDETREAMRDVYTRTGYMLDPHGAVGYLGIKKALKTRPNSLGVLLETAHPAKFAEVTESTLGVTPDMPERLRAFAEKEKEAHAVPNNYEAVKSIVEG
ncbi:MAG: threonine synthase [Cryomorphaceae bacterium]